MLILMIMMTARIQESAHPSMSPDCWNTIEYKEISEASEEDNDSAWGFESMRSLVQSESDDGMWSARPDSDSEDESDDDPRCQLLTSFKEESFRQWLEQANAVSTHPEGAFAFVDELITTQSLVQSADAIDYDPQ